MTQKTASLNKRPKTAARTKNRLAACLRRLMPIVCLVGIAVAYTLHTGKPVWTLFPHRDTGKLLEEARSGNNAQAQFTLGRMYYKGDGVPRDLHEAARWFHKAAEQGHAPAEEALRRQDIRQAHKDNIAAEFEEWARPRREALLRRAQEGDAEARYKLGEAYSSGDLGLPEDETQAIIWYRKAGEQDHVAAQRALAKRYQDGIGVPKDTAEALKWYRRAGELGDEISREKLAHMYRTGDGVPRDMQQALVWYRKLAEGGSLNSMEEIAKIYAAGDGVSRDMEEALSWYRKLAYRDPHSGSPEEIARIYDKGDGVPRDTAQAAVWYGVSVLHNANAESAFRLARIHAAGDGVPRDMDKAILWHYWAADLGSIPAFLELGNIHAAGDGVPRDPWLAAALYRQAGRRNLSYQEIVQKKLEKLQGDIVGSEPYEEVMDRILTLRMETAQFTLLHAYDKGYATRLDRAKVAAVYASCADGNVFDNLDILARLRKDADGDLPPRIRELADAVQTEAKAIRRALLLDLGRWHAEGDGVPKHPGLGLYYYRRAAGLGAGEARAALKRLIPDIVPAPGAEKAGQSAQPAGEDPAADLLAAGMACWRGDGVPEDRAQAVDYFRKAVKQGNAEAARILARCCFFGEGTEQSDAEAYYHLFMYALLRDRFALLTDSQDAERFMVGNVPLSEAQTFLLEAAQRSNRPLPETEKGLLTACGSLLSPPDQGDILTRVGKDLMAIRQRMTAH